MTSRGIRKGRMMPEEPGVPNQLDGWAGLSIVRSYVRCPGECCRWFRCIEMAHETGGLRHDRPARFAQARTRTRGETCGDSTRSSEVIFRELSGTPMINYKATPLLTWAFVRHQGLEPRTR